LFGRAHTIAAFHRLYYGRGRGERHRWSETYWLGVPCQKCPLDLWIYQEILFEMRPDLVVETGSAAGGSALYLASILDLLGKGQVLSIDIKDHEQRPAHPRVTFLRGSSTAAPVVEEVSRRADQRRVLVILDSDHGKDHVLAELRAYSRLVSEGGYLIVEDTNVNGHPVQKKHGPGPAEAVAQFLDECTDFEVDRAREKFLLTFNPSGYLRRRKTGA
jgi:cephalosporin hydroxylase